MVNQGHLAPLSLFALPVYWALDHCLMLHPTPDVIIVADKDSFTTSYNEANIFSPVRPLLFLVLGVCCGEEGCNLSHQPFTPYLK